MSAAYNNIPNELRERRQWAVWKREGDNKPPHRADRNGKASSTDPSTWTTFEEAVAAAENGYDGLAFALTEADPYAFVDLDDCFIDGELHHSARATIERLDSFTELSQSGEGLHVLPRAKLASGNHSAKGKSKHGVPWHRDGRESELAAYDHNRFVYITGDVFEGRETIEDRQLEAEHVQGLIARYRAPKRKPPPSPPPIENEYLDALVDALDGRSRGDEHCARCPHHRGQSDDSLTIKPGDRGNLLLHCFADCEYADVLRACREQLGLPATSAAPSGNARREEPTEKKREAERERRSQSPMPSPDDVRRALAQSHRFYTRFLVMLPAGRVFLACWNLHTYLFDAAETTPYPSIRSPERESGKTRVLEVANLIARDAEQVADASISALFRLSRSFSRRS